jgi:hypothetical protein
VKRVGREGFYKNASSNREEEMPMAYGSMRPMRSEANKVFDRDAKPAHMSDGRVDPLVPLGAVLSRWQWGWVRPTPSTEQIGERLGDERWRARLGLKPEQGGSPDRAAPMLDGLSLEEWNEMMLEDFFVARRAGILTDDGLYGKRGAVLDLSELFKSEKVHGDQCQVREKTIREGDGEKRLVRAIALTRIDPLLLR